MKKIDFCKISSFPSFFLFFFSFFFFQCGASGQSLLASGREWSQIFRTRPAYVRMLAATIGRTISNTVQTCATCLLVPNVARVRTTLMHRPDGDPTEAIYTP